MELRKLASASRSRAADSEDERDDVNGRITIPGSFDCFHALLALSPPSSASMEQAPREAAFRFLLHIFPSIYIFHAQWIGKWVAYNIALASGLCVPCVSYPFFYIL